MKTLSFSKTVTLGKSYYNFENQTSIKDYKEILSSNQQISIDNFSIKSYFISFLIILTKHMAMALSCDRSITRKPNNADTE